MMDLFKETKKGYGRDGKSAHVGLACLPVPPSMNLYPEGALSLRLSSSVPASKTDRFRRIHAAVSSGTEDDFFHEGGRKAALFRQDAFREDAGHTSLFSMPRFPLPNFRDFLDEMMKEKGDGDQAVKILTFNPWHAFRDGDGTYH